jgi:hypothetical protein
VRRSECRQSPNGKDPLTSALAELVRPRYEGQWRSVLLPTKFPRKLNHQSQAKPRSAPPATNKLRVLPIANLVRLASDGKIRSRLPHPATGRWLQNRYTINLPFSRIGMSVGDPIFVPRDAKAEELKRWRQVVEGAMNDVTRQAYAQVGAHMANATMRS